MKKGIIIGAGIGGITTGIALQKKGFEVTIFEHAAELGEVGAGIWVAPNGLKVFEKLGFADEVIQAGRELDLIGVMDTNGKIFSKIISSEIKARHRFSTIAIHRAVLHNILVKHFGKENIITNKHFERFSQEGNKIQAFFSDQSMEESEFLIAADGIKSNARKQFLPSVQLRYSGQTCWRFIANYKLPESESAKMYEIWGNARGLRAAYSQINDDQVYCYITDFRPSGGSDNREHLKTYLLSLCAPFNKIVKEIIHAADQNKIIRNDLFDFSPIGKWTEGKIALLGDAAHATTPNLGQGACQAIEDAWFIGEAMAKNEIIEDAFLQYQRQRINKAKYITDTSYQIAMATNTTGFVKSMIKTAMALTPDFISNMQFDRIYNIQE